MEKKGLTHQQVIIDEKSGEKYLKVRLSNVKLTHLKVYKNDELTEFEIIEKKRKGKNKKGGKPSEAEPTEETKEPATTVRYFI